MAWNRDYGYAEGICPLVARSNGFLESRRTMAMPPSLKPPVVISRENLNGNGNNTIETLFWTRGTVVQMPAISFLLPCMPLSPILYCSLTTIRSSSLFFFTYVVRYLVSNIFLSEYFHISQKRRERREKRYSVATGPLYIRTPRRTTS